MPRTDNDKPILWTISMTRLEALFRDVAPEYDDRARIHNLHGGYEEAVGLLQRRLARQPCDVMVAAGSNGSYIKKHIDKPVVLVEPSGFDLMQALNRARQRQPDKRIAVVTHREELPTFSEFCASYGLDIEHRSFQTAEDARASVDELRHQGVGTVVGTGLITELAEAAGLASVLLYSPDSIRRALNAALDMAAALGNQGPGDSSRRSGQGQGAKYGLDQLLGSSEAMQRVREQVQRFAGTDTTLLIHGATGTGKERVAQAIHVASKRRRQSFVAINCGAIAESLLESELFGHDEGAFTGARRGGRPGLIEAAHRGTLFLDEIGEMPLPLQTRLLRVLEEREVLRVGSNRPIPLDLRVIAASHCNLDAMVASGEFRSDLYYRLNVLRLDLPTLAQRRDDLTELLAHFVQEQRPQWTVEPTPQAREVLGAYHWPGNLRELRNLAERLVLHVQAGPEHLHLEVTPSVLQQCAPELFISLQSTSPSPGPDERGELEAVLRDSLGNREEAARRLGISRSTLWRRMRAHGL